MINLIYSLAIFIGSFLLFTLQIITAKALLPSLGGGPAIWNVAMVFYQIVLLMGYTYAHIIKRITQFKYQIWLHVILLILSGVYLPLSLDLSLGFVPISDMPITWMLLTLFISIFLPLFILSSNASLLQSWFVRTKLKTEPYFLYAISNIGSFLALISYPFLIEPFISVSSQFKLWSVIYVIFTVLLGGCAFYVSKGQLGKVKKKVRKITNSVKWVDRAKWIIFAFVPSSLFLGMTSYITSDIASIPLLWIIPLALYLLSFVIIFGSKYNLYERGLNAQVGFTVLLALMFVGIKHYKLVFVILHLFAFFAVAIVCHGRLFKSRPEENSNITEFYLWMAVGGALGGVFNAIISPLIFTYTTEYPLMIIAAYILRPASKQDSRQERYRDFILPAVFFAALYSCYKAFNFTKLQYGDKISKINDYLEQAIAIINIDVKTIAEAILTLGFLFLCYKSYARPIRFALIIAAFLLSFPSKDYTEEVVFRDRSFFGTLEVIDDHEDNVRRLHHGVTIHGIQGLNNLYDKKISSYYAPLKEVFDGLPEHLSNTPVAVVGLGVGTVACYGKEGQIFDFYEINPEVRDVANKYFTYLSDCPAKSNIIIGDGRLSLLKSKTKYGLIILDAYSSDSLPVHLITKEALSIYKEHLLEGGIIAFHISNRYLNLAPVLFWLGDDADLTILNKYFRYRSTIEYPSTWAIMFEGEKEAYNAKTGWMPPPRLDNIRLWTDDFSNILQILR